MKNTLRNWMGTKEKLTFSGKRRQSKSNVQKWGIKHGGNGIKTYGASCQRELRGQQKTGDVIIFTENC